MADPGPSRHIDEKYDRKRKQRSNEENTKNNLPLPKKLTKNELHDVDATPNDRNMSGIKRSLHGISYQIKLCIFVCLVNAKKSMNPKDKFNFEVTAEDAAAGKFDDIVYSFEDGEKKGRLNIQAKHKLGSPAPMITLKDLTTISDTNNPFSIVKYFASYCDQQPSTTDLEGFIICTNTNIDNNAKNMLQTVDPTVMDDSAASLDFYISTLFKRIGGQCYRLDYDKLCSTDGMFNNLHQLLRKCSKSARLARVLVESIQSMKKITRKESLYKEYRLAILSIIDTNETSTKDLYGFTKDFLDSLSFNSTPGYEAFRKEFENQYQQEFSINGSVWDDLKQKRVNVAKDFMSDKSDKSSESFPEENVDQMMESFCDKFRLWCNTNNENKLEGAIVDLWKNLYWSDNDLRNGCVEENVAGSLLFKSNFDWLINPFAKPIHSEDTKEELEKIKNTLAHMKLTGISEKLRNTVLGSIFRISYGTLQKSELYSQIEDECLLEVEAHDVQFGVTLLSDILNLQNKQLVCTLFLDDSDVTNDSDSIEEVLYSYEQPFCLIIIYNEAIKTIKTIARKWKKDILKDSKKQIFLIKKTSRLETDLGCFRIGDLTEESWKRFLSKDISICATVVPAKIFQHNFHEHSVEEFIKVLNWGEQTEENNEIVQKYRLIEDSYAHRYWIHHENKLKADNLSRYNHKNILENILKLQGENISFKEIAKRIAEYPKFKSIFLKANKPKNKLQQMFRNTSKRVLILLGEAGVGKSTNLTWLAWHLWKQNPSSWVVRCNLSDHCTAFKAFIQNSKNMVIDEIVALQMLYKLIHSSLQVALSNAEKCSKCLVLLDEEAHVSEDMVKHLDLSLNNSIQLLVFKEKFNSGDLVLLLDGFDEIAPHYKEVVLQFIVWFSTFKGVRKLYLTSRPYDFKNHFQHALKGASFFVLKPLSLQDKGSLLYKMMKEKWRTKREEDEEVVDFYRALCILILYQLDEMSDIPLNLMMSVEILEQSVDQCVYISSKTVDSKLFNDMGKMFKPSFMVEEFVKTKIQLLLYEKNGTDRNVADKPSEIEKIEKAIDEIKFQHGLLALLVLFEQSELNFILLDKEVDEANKYINAIGEAKEKTGIINDVKNGIPVFIHRTFAEFMAAWWIVKRCMEVTQQQHTINRPSLDLFDYPLLIELQKHVDSILTKHHPLHLAIIEKDWNTVDALLSDNSKAINEKDDSNRTPLHLLAQCIDIPNDCSRFLPKTIDSNIINVKEVLFGWSALDYALERDNTQMICYLLNHGATINEDILYEQIDSCGTYAVRQAAIYANHVMAYLNQEAIEHKSNTVCKIMKQFCDKVAVYLINEASTNFEQTVEYRSILRDELCELSDHEKSILMDIIKLDSVWMLESIIKQLADRKTFKQVIMKSVFNLAWEKNSILCILYFVEYDSSLLNTDDLWKCIVHAIVWDYKREFKMYVDFFCNRIRIKGFQPCSIRNEDIENFITSSFRDREIEKICESRGTISRNIPSVIMIDQNIFSLLVGCVAIGRSSMLRYLKESCNLNLGADVVYHLARIVYNLFSHIIEFSFITDTKSGQPFECLFELASNINDDEANKMFRLAMTTDLFKVSKCLIKRYNINLKAFDELKGWNMLHLCASRPQSRQYNGDKSMLDLFCYLFNRMEMDCFDTFDKNGKSVLHLALENRHSKIVRWIVARKLGLNDLKDVRSLGEDAISNLVSCCSAIHIYILQERKLLSSTSTTAKIFQIFGTENYSQNVLCMLAEQIVKISLANRDELSRQQSAGHLLFQKSADDWYHTAINYSSPFLMYYLHREFRCSIQSPINDADWLSCIANSLNSSNIRLFQWIVSFYCVDHRIALAKGAAMNEDIDYDDMYNVRPFILSRFLNELIQAIEVKISGHQSKGELCVLKLIILAVSQNHELALEYLCKTFEVNIDQKGVFDIMEKAHQMMRKGWWCKGTYFLSINKYLFERCSNVHEIDTEGRNMLHVAAQSGPNCMIRTIVNHSAIQITIINTEHKLNALDYYASRPPGKYSCYTTDAHLFRDMLERVLEGDENTIEGMTLSREKRIEELCFNSNDGRKSVIHRAFEAGNFDIIECIIQLYFEIDTINEHTILDLDEYSSFRDFYDMLNQLAAQLSFNAASEMLLDRIAKPIDSFSLANIKNKTEPENADHDHIKNACQNAIKYRSLTTLEYLIVACKHQVNQALTKSTSRELFACMMECIRRNRPSLFKAIVGHYRTLRGIQPSVEVEYEEEGIDQNDERSTDEDNIQWQIIDQKDHNVSINHDCLRLLILSIAYGRLSMTKYLIEMLQLVINKQLILLIIKMLVEFTQLNRGFEKSYPIFDYLVRKIGENPNILHLCAEAEEGRMLRYLIENKHLDPNEVDSENRWHVAHYCVAKPWKIVNSWNSESVLEQLLKNAHIDCFCVYDQNGRNILQLAIENGHTKELEIIINSKLGNKHYENVKSAVNLEKIEECIKELQRIETSFPKNRNYQYILQKLIDRKTELTGSWN